MVAEGTANDDAVDIAIVGAGPCGLAVAIAAKRAGLSSKIFDRGPIVGGIASYPPYMTFFSTADKLSIGGIPFVVATPKPSRRDALAYYRFVASYYDLNVRQYEQVTDVQSLGQSLSTSNTSIASSSTYSDSWLETRRTQRWLLRSTNRLGKLFETRAHAVVVATGYFGRPNRLGVIGEQFPHVRHGYSEGHFAWDQDVTVVGGGNSAVDAALEMHQAGARVSIVHFESQLDSGVKPWVRPEIEARIAEGSIVAYFNSRVSAIGEDWVELINEFGESFRIRATQVYELTGFLPETALLEALGVPIDPDTGIPAHDPISMATPLPGVYLAGVIASGNRANRIFIENGRDHGEAIVASITG